MNKLPAEKRAQILHLLCEGSSLRAVTRLTGASINTVTKLLVDAGSVCGAYQDKALRSLKAKRVQVDEIWAFVGSKQKNIPDEKKDQGYGDCWTWVALDADSKLVISWALGQRNAEYAQLFMQDVASRLANRIQLTSDGLHAYMEAVDTAFKGDIDYAMLVKIYGHPSGGRYSPGECIGAKPKAVTGNPDPKHISTSYVERQNLTMRMHMRRFTRLTNAFSKKLENHALAVSLHFMFYNFCRIHKTLRVTPAMQAGIADRVWEISDIVSLIEAAEASN